jgi:hypothetical protein
VARHCGTLRTFVAKDGGWLSAVNSTGPTPASTEARDPVST